MVPALVNLPVAIDTIQSSFIPLIGMSGKRGKCVSAINPISAAIAQRFETLLHGLCPHRTLVESDLDAWWTQALATAAKHDPHPSGDAPSAPRTSMHLVANSWT